MKYRNELKFVLREIDAELIRSMIAAACVLDEHADSDGIYSIKSIYFDTIYDKCLYETLDGVNTRHKYRVRRYGDTDCNYKFEKKLAENGLKCKIIDTISENDLRKLLRDEYSLVRCKENQDDEMSSISDFVTESMLYKYRAVAVIGYTRRPYIYPIGNVRITFDSDIQVTDDIEVFFCGYNGLEYEVLKDAVIMEVKYDDILPGFIRDILNASCIMEQSAFSKYASARLAMAEGTI